MGLQWMIFLQLTCIVSWNRVEAYNDQTLKYLSKFPKNEYEYSFNRDMLVETERKFEQRGELLNEVSHCWTFPC